MDFLRYLRLSGVKAAYRQKALETHPDRARVIGVEPSFLVRKFRETTDAYEKLRAFVTGVETVFVSPVYHHRPVHRAWQPPRPNPARPSEKPDGREDFFFNGALPKRKLMLGQYLYYSGRVSWKTLISAITWQKLQRPPIGRLAVNSGFLLDTHVRRILEYRRFGEKFGQSAIRLGYLTQAELLWTLEKQRRLQHLFGQYFLKTGKLSHSELVSMLAEQRIHNRGFGI